MRKKNIVSCLLLEGTNISVVELQQGNKHSEGSEVPLHFLLYVNCRL